MVYTGYMQGTCGGNKDLKMDDYLDRSVGSDFRLLPDVLRGLELERASLQDQVRRKRGCLSWAVNNVVACFAPRGNIKVGCLIC